MKPDWVKVCTIQNFEWLRSKDFTNFIIEESDGLDYLPDNFVEYTPNRNWLAIYVSDLNFSYSIENYLDTQKFQSYVKEELAKREQLILQKQQLTMDVDADFAKSLNDSQMVYDTSLFH